MDKKKFSKKSLLSWLAVIALAVAFAFVIRIFVLAPVIVDGKSMYPTYDNHDRLFMQKITPPKRGDKVVFDASRVSPANKGSNFIKRVIGLPGDKIEFRSGNLYLNGKRKVEKYLPAGMKTYSSPRNGIGTFTLKDITGKSTVPPKKLFVLGDNRDGSSDSRVFGFINATDVQGVIIDF